MPRSEAAPISSASRSRPEGGDDQQHGVRAGRPRLQQLVLVDHEVLAQQRQVARGAGLDEVVEAAAEVLGSVSTETARAPAAW